MTRPPDLAGMTDAQLAAYFAALDAEDEERDARLNDPAALARSARWYARNGVAVFPLAPGGKRPLFRSAHDTPADQRECAGRCGRDGHGLYDGTVDLDRVEQWWTAAPQANIGLPTGHLFDVVDIDGPPGMRTYIDQIIHGSCPRRPDGVTPSCCDHGHDCHGSDALLVELVGKVLGVAGTAGENGGLHLYVRPTGDENGANIMPGIDYRGLGGYVVAPPSRGRLGRYTWRQPLDLGLLAAP